MAEVAEEREPTIYLPAPDGHRRGSLRFINGLMIAVTCSPEELSELIGEFRADPGRKQLLLHDAQFNEPYYLQREPLDEGHLLAIGVEWVKNPAPETGSRGGVHVARVMPEQRPNRGRRLH